MDQRRTFAVVLEPEEEGGFTVRVPAFPEIVTYGKDEREALAMAEDAIRLVIEDCTARAGFRLQRENQRHEIAQRGKPCERWCRWGLGGQGLARYNPGA